jgi:signal transduction histidine kinase/ActR/RegA family two-component response regulator
MSAKRRTRKLTPTPGLASARPRAVRSIAGVPLEEVIAITELDDRPARAPDFESESRALVGLMKALREADANVLQKLAETALSLCRAHSAGVSLEEEQQGRRVFRWHGAAGRWAPFIGRAVPRDASPCGVVVDRNVPLLMRHPGRHFTFPYADVPPITEALLVPFTADGVAVGTIWLGSHDQSRRFDREDLRVLASLGECASLAYRALARNAAMQVALVKERADFALLRAISAALIRENDIDALYEQILDAATSIMGSERASLQILGEGKLCLLGWRGFDAASVRYWQEVRADSASACGRALSRKERVVIEDTELCEVLAGTKDLAEFRRAGIRSVQSTPLISRTGELVGILSTHWRAPHSPAAGELRLLDVLARMAADLIERARTEQAMREVDRRKDEFLAILSHELRNPLAPITTGLELLRRPDNPPELIASIHLMMSRQISHLTRLVNDLLDLSRITRGTIELQRATIELSGVIGAAVDLARPLIDQRGHDLVVEQPVRSPCVNGDLERLTQVVSNVLGNAARYTDPGGRIHLVVRNEDGYALIIVRDSGLGIPAGQLEQVFGMFAQVPEHRARGGGGGLGVGLALARRLIELHGGTIVARSAGLGHGSEFVIRLRLADAAELSDEVMRHGVNDAHAAGRRILIVEDNVDAADSLRTALESLGHTVRTAQDASEGLAAVDEFSPQAVLLDIGLPGIDGYEAARRVRSSLGRGVQLIAVTGWGQERDRERARQAGFDAHLTKPISIGALASVLNREASRVA